MPGSRAAGVKGCAFSGFRAPGYAATMPLLNSNSERQLAGFVVVTIGWTPGTAAVGLAECPVRCSDTAALSPPGRPGPRTLNVAASLCISMTVVWNYRSVMNEEEVAFPPPLNVPFKPDTQQTGGDVLLRVWLPSRCFQPEMKHLFFKVMGLFLSYLAWGFGISLARSRSWRMREFDSKTVPIVFIGLWEPFYFQKFNISGSIAELLMHSKINSSWVISDEIWCGQDLMLLANFMMSAVLIFGSVALSVSWIKAPYPGFLQLHYNTAAFFLLLSCGCTMITVSWNFTVEFYGETILDFPITFSIKREMLTKKCFSYMFPLGITTTILSLLSATMFSCETCPLKQWTLVKPLAVANCRKQEVWTKAYSLEWLGIVFLKKFLHMCHIVIITFLCKIKYIWFFRVHLKR
ncbi:uncharacterized protein LOC135320269 [Camelus dromedarius]|uniref:uncharacterized protein LOC135320269 n=1 Tax=Camelus dromedarius TaxID=9838 RepID=UPI003119B344